MNSQADLILALVAPTIFASKYGVQFTKNFFQQIVPAKLQADVTRLYALVFGAATLPILALALAPKFHVVFTLTAINVASAAVFGAGSGLASIGDYHLLDALKAWTAFGNPTPPPTPPPTSKT